MRLFWVVWFERKSSPSTQFKISRNTQSASTKPPLRRFGSIVGGAEWLRHTICCSSLKGAPLDELFEVDLLRFDSQFILRVPLNKAKR